MITLAPCNADSLARAQLTVTDRHYLHAPVDSRCAPLAYDIGLHTDDNDYRIGVLIFGRPEATRCYDGQLTYGSAKDVASGRAQYDRWEVLNLARVWLHPRVQAGGDLCAGVDMPGYYDRRGQWRSTLASTVLGMALARINYDYLIQKPPCFPDEPYQLHVVLSYCDTRVHRGTIYRASGFELARTNKDGIETWHTPNVAPLSTYENDQVLKRAGQSFRSRRYRAARAAREQQEILL
jgi:hypothetical protein